MTSETALHLAKARKCLANARASLGFGLTEDAGRSAYLTAYHAARAFVFERTGKLAKTHEVVQREFHRLARGEPRIDKEFPPFLTQAYNLKAVADYETGPDSEIPADHAGAAIRTAAHFLDCVVELLGEA